MALDADARACANEGVEDVEDPSARWNGIAFDHGAIPA
jgi:hypothetical protein